MKKIHYYSFLTLVLFLSFHVTGLKAQDDYIKTIDRWTDSILTQTKLPGLILGVWAPDKVEYVKAKGKLWAL